jgi:hypothetical protein
MVVAALGGAGTAAAISHFTHHNTNLTAQTTAKKPSPIHYISYKGVQGKNALALLQTHAQVSVKSSSYGPYVDAINGVRGGTSGKYWMFYVNGKQASVGAGSYITKVGDFIEWKFQ